MNKFRFVCSVLLVFLASVAAHATEVEIVSCNLEFGGGAERGIVTLSVDESGKLYTRSGTLDGPLFENSYSVVVSAIESFPIDLIPELEKVNSVRSTGIDPQNVKQMQRIKINGDDHESYLVRLMNAHGRSLGWLLTGSVLSGCYPN